MQFASSVPAGKIVTIHKFASIKSVTFHNGFPILSQLIENYNTVLNEINLSIEQLNQEQLEIINSIKLQ